MYRQSEITIRRDGRIRRRDFLRTIAAGAAGSALTWTDLVTLEASELRDKGMACILLWMQGGPSQFETFDPKPNHANGGATRDIATAVPGVRIAANLPETAKVMDDVCLIRSMTSREGSHPRASFLMHTGYLPTASVKYPTLGSNIVHQIGDVESELPSFVRIGRVRSGARGGFLGVEFDPFEMDSAERPPNNTTPATERSRYRRRLNLLDKLETQYEESGAAREVEDHRKLYEKTSRMVLSSQMKAFDLDSEPRVTRDAYGRTPFGSGCLLARRLVESGVTFVEVSAGNWDTHQDNFPRTTELCQQVDGPFAQLVSDLKQRGRLEQTLIVWMGEFGRTPRINPRGGRDHYPRAFSVAMAGGPVRGGHVVGATDASGATVTDRPVGVPDLLRTVCHSLEIDADHEHMSNVGRPIKIVDGGEVIREVVEG